MKVYENFKPKSEDFESFVSRNIGIKKQEILESSQELELPNKVKNFNLEGLVNPEYDNVLYIKSKELNSKVPKNFNSNYKGYEIHIDKEKENYYSFTKIPIPKSTKIKVNFGCELETCFILNCKSMKAKEDLEKITNTKDIHKIKRISNKQWQKVIVYHLKNNIIPFLKPEFINIFRYAYIFKGYHSESGNLLMDMTTGEILEKISDTGNYKTLIFEPDGSIKCDLEEGLIPIQCEIVTPVLSNIDELRILYEGLISDNCNQSNKSMGFHVNVSAVDDSGKIIQLSEGMLMEFIYNWLPYENKNYKKLRGEEPSGYARPIQKYYDDIEDLIKKTKNIKTVYGKELNISEIYEPYSVGIKEMVQLMNTDKFLSATHHKGNNVIEFRIFGGTKNIDSLLSYTEDAIDVFYRSVKSFCDKPEEIIAKIQVNNLKYKIIKNENTEIFSNESFEIVDNTNYSPEFSVYSIKQYFKESDFDLYAIYTYENQKTGLLGYFQKSIMYKKYYEFIWDLELKKDKKYHLIFKSSDFTTLIDTFYEAEFELIEDKKVKFQNIKIIENFMEDESFIKLYSY